MGNSDNSQLRATRVRKVSRVVLVVSFIAAGLNHFLHEDFYLAIIPDYLPWPHLLVMVSGACEAGLGLLAALPGRERAARFGLVALLVAVFPANLQMALHADRYPEFSEFSLWLRLPLQVVLVGWVIWTLQPSRHVA